MGSSATSEGAAHQTTHVSAVSDHRWRPARPGSRWASCGCGPARDQAGKLVTWAQAWPERTWAVEGARGLGRLLEAGDTNKTDPDDARSVAMAALRSKGRQEVTADGHAVVL